MGTVVVRRATQADLDALLSLYGELVGSKVTAAPADRASSEPLLAEILADPRRELAVALVDGQVVGTADLIVIPNLTHRGTPWGIVENVIVAGAARRSGVGRALFRHLIEMAPHGWLSQAPAPLRQASRGRARVLSNHGAQRGRRGLQDLLRRLART